MVVSNTEVCPTEYVKQSGVEFKKNIDDTVAQFDSIEDAKTVYGLDILATFNPEDKLPGWYSVRYPEAIVLNSALHEREDAIRGRSVDKLHVCKTKKDANALIVEYITPTDREIYVVAGVAAIPMTEKPSTSKCKYYGCEHLEGKTVETVKGTRTSWYCKLSGKIPGNMATCPLRGDE